MRRTIAFAFMSCICFSAPAFAQATYPSRPITIIVPYPPGGNLDVITRLISPSMSQSLGQTIVVDNKPGAGGLIGHSFTTRANADGYTILTTANGSLAYAPKLQPQPPFKAADFAALGSIAVTPMVLEVKPAATSRASVILSPMPGSIQGKSPSDIPETARPITSPSCCWSRPGM